MSVEKFIEYIIAVGVCVICLLILYVAVDGIASVASKCKNIYKMEMVK